MLQYIKIYAFFLFQFHYFCGHIILSIQKKGTDKASLDLKKKNTFLKYALSLQKTKIIALAGGEKVDLIILSYPRMI